jgi:hypothetical protein
MKKEAFVPEKDLLGRSLTDLERDLMDVYESLKKLAVAPDAPPCVHQNVRKALACLWQATHDLDLQFEQLYDLGV